MQTFEQFLDTLNDEELQLMDSDPEFFSQMKSEFEKTQAPSIPRQIAQAATTPIRGFRGMGVTAQRLVEGSPLQEALQRGSEATKPGFEPRPGEKIGSAIGSATPFLPLAALGGIPAAAASGGTSALEQLSEKGKINPVETALSTVLGGIAKPAAKAGVGAAKLGAKVYSTVTAPPLEETGKKIGGILAKTGARPARTLEATVQKPPININAAINELNSLGKKSSDFKKQSLKWLYDKKERVNAIITSYTKNPSRQENLGKAALDKAMKMQESLEQMFKTKMSKKAPEYKSLAKDYSLGRKREDVKKILEGVPVIGKTYKSMRQVKKILDK